MPIEHFTRDIFGLFTFAIDIYSLSFFIKLLLIIVKMLRCCNVFVELKYFGAINKIYIVVQIGGWEMLEAVCSKRGSPLTCWPQGILMDKSLRFDLINEYLFVV